MRTLLIALAALPLLAAAPAPRGLALQVPSDGEMLPVPRRPAPRPAATFQPAPLPNRDVDAPTARAGNAPYVAPSLFTRTDTYRGEGYAPGSTAASEQERKVKPGAGFNLRMPFAPE